MELAVVVMRNQRLSTVRNAQLRFDFVLRSFQAALDRLDVHLVRTQQNQWFYQASALLNELSPSLCHSHFDGL